jgi:polymorphic toxin system nucleotidyltransferase-like protein
MILFGSRARNLSDEDSDYDVAVLSRDGFDARTVRRILSDLAYDHVLSGFFIRPIPLSSWYLDPGRPRSRVGRRHCPRWCGGRVTSKTVHAEVSWRKAVAHLKEAAAQDTDASPMAVIHSSYYAMFTRRAVLFKATGDAPKWHDTVIQRFGLLVRDLDEAMRASEQSGMRWRLCCLGLLKSVHRRSSKGCRFTPS